jgi:hypothetical protein
MSNPEKVEVVIYDAPAIAGGGCGCGCAGHNHGQEGGHPPEPNMEWQTRALALTLESAFPGRVQVEYVNVLKDQKGPGLPQTQLLCSLAYPPPLVYINGRGRFAGALPVGRIREEVGDILGTRG